MKKDKTATEMNVQTMTLYHRKNKELDELIKKDIEQIKQDTAKNVLEILGFPEHSYPYIEGQYSSSPLTGEIISYKRISNVINEYNLLNTKCSECGQVADRLHKKITTNPNDSEVLCESCLSKKTGVA